MILPSKTLRQYARAIKRRVVMSVNAETLLSGSLFALQQCGLLVTDASLLFERGRRATAAGVALLAHEELGRHKILLDLWKSAVEGTVVTPDEVRTRTTDHVAKQRAGQMSVTYRLDADDELSRLLRARHAAIGTPEYGALDEQVKRIDRSVAKRQPHDRHEWRESAFYVDLLDDGVGWSRPSDLSGAKCARAVCDAINDYAGRRDRFESPEVNTDEVLVRALAAMSAKPVLPEPPFNSAAFHEGF